MKQNDTARYPRAFLSQFTTNQLHLRNPYLVAMWSLILPGFGNLLQDRHIKGLSLVIWTFIVNNCANINLAGYYSITGRPDLAREVVNTRWLLLYIGVYIYAAWDGYRGTVDANKLFLLAEGENATVQPLTIKTFDINFLDKRSPWIAAAWSSILPGLGNLYVHKIIPGFFFIGSTITVAYHSHVLQAIHLTCTGDFGIAKSVLNMQWLLYIPTMYGFGIYDAYVSTVEYNKLFKQRQSKWLRDQYQKHPLQPPLQ